MAKPLVLLFGPMMAAFQADWTDQFEAVLLENADAALPADLAARIEVIACGENLPNRVVDALPALKLVACFSTGYTGIDLAHLQKRGIGLTTAGGINAHDVADHAIALLLALWHRVPDFDRRVRKGGWRDARDARPSLRGRRAGVVGLGRIGSAIASRLAAHELVVSWWGPHPKPESPYPRAESLLELAAQSDILVIASRADPKNTHQIDAEVLDALGPEAIVVNISRGFLIDEDALVDALSEGRLGGAALDVFEQEPTNRAKWSGVPNLVMTPHIAGFTLEAGRDLRAQQRENVRRFFAGEELLSQVGNSSQKAHPID